IRGFGGYGAIMGPPMSSALSDLETGIVAGSRATYATRERGLKLKTTSATRPLDRLAALQRADGSWDLTKELAEAVGKTLGELREALRGAEGDATETERALATALAVVWLELKAADARDEWLLLAAKAERWLEAVQARPATGGDWHARAVDLLRHHP